MKIQGSEVLLTAGAASLALALTHRHKNRVRGVCANADANDQDSGYRDD
jgi:hypothetical protein